MKILHYLQRLVNDYSNCLGFLIEKVVSVIILMK